MDLHDFSAERYPEVTTEALAAFERERARATYTGTRVWFVVLCTSFSIFLWAPIIGGFAFWTAAGHIMIVLGRCNSLVHVEIRRAGCKHF